jgi:acyl-CoA thioester hydrolase
VRHTAWPNNEQDKAVRLELPKEKKWVFDMDVPIRWGDMDVMGHVNNTLYFRYLEVARLEWMYSLGVKSLPQAAGPVIANAFCNFIRQVSYPGTVRVRTYVSAPGRSSFETWHEVMRTDDVETICATGGATVVWADMVAEKSVPLPDFMRAHLG